MSPALARTLLACALATIAAAAAADPHYTAVLVDVHQGGIQALGANGVAVGYTLPLRSDRVARSLAIKGGRSFTFAPLGYERSFAHAISSAGDIAGEITPPPHSTASSYLRRADGTTSLVEVMDAGIVARPVQVYGVNASGTVVGWYTDRHDHFIAYSWRDGVSTSHPSSLGGAQSWIFGIDDRGLMVGSAEVAANVEHAVTWAPDGTLTELPALPGGNGVGGALGVSANGTIVGSTTASDGWSHAVTWRAGTVTDLGTLPRATWSSAYAIDSAGNVVGQSGVGPLHDGSYVVSAVLWRNGRPIDLAAITTLPPDTTMTAAIGIADDGTLLVSGATHGNTAGATLILTPDAN